MRMQTQPVGKSVFGDVACGDGQHGQHAVCIIDNEAPTVELQKKLGRYQSSTLVTVDKRVIARNTVAMRCSQGSSVGIAVRRRACLPVVFRPKALSDQKRFNHLCQLLGLVVVQHVACVFNSRDLGIGYQFQALVILGQGVAALVPFV